MNNKLANHTIVVEYTKNFFLLYNVLLRNGVLLDKNFFYNQNLKKFYFKNISSFSLSKSLVDNPNGLLSKIDINKIELVSKAEIVNMCNQLYIFSKNYAYLERVGSKNSIFDRQHIGNFHQQIGQHLLGNKKTNPEEWWIYQKFTKNLDTTKNNPYKWVQENFIKSFFNNDLLNNKTILDFGGGVGYYSNYFATHSKEVDVVEPSEIYVDIGKRKFGNKKNLNFFVRDFKKKDDLNFTDKKYDFIFLIDVFLYFFVPYQQIEISPTELLKELSLKLKENGKIFIIDPHGIFHLQSHFNQKSPFVISTEYSNKKYRVTPTLEEISLAFEKSGLKISKIRELKYQGNDEDKTFYKEFPFWWFFELIN